MYHFKFILFLRIDSQKVITGEKYLNNFKYLIDIVKFAVNIVAIFMLTEE